MGMSFVVQIEIVATFVPALDLKEVLFLLTLFGLGEGPKGFS